MLIGTATVAAAYTQTERRACRLSRLSLSAIYVHISTPWQGLLAFLPFRNGLNWIGSKCSTFDFDAVVVDVDAMLAALLRRERDHVDAFLHFAHSVRQRTAAMNEVELGLTPSGFRRVARKREFFSRYCSRDVQQLLIAKFKGGKFQ